MLRWLRLEVLSPLEEAVFSLPLGLGVLAYVVMVLALADLRVSSVAARLRDISVTHLLFAVRDVDFILQHDPTGEHRRAAGFFLQEFRGSCARQIYRESGHACSN